MFRAPFFSVLSLSVMGCLAHHAEPNELAEDLPIAVPEQRPQEPSEQERDAADDWNVQSEQLSIADMEEEPMPAPPAPMPMRSLPRAAPSADSAAGAGAVPSTVTPSGARTRGAPRTGSIATSAPVVSQPTEAPTFAATDRARNTEEYTDHGVNPFVLTEQDNLSTFSIDVDTASYTVARSKIEDGMLPPAAAVRVEEFINYFDHDYAPPTGDAHPFAVHFDAFPDPFHRDRHILRVGVQAEELAPAQRPALHLTFLVDVSGSMSSADKLPLAQQALHMLVDTLQEGDTVALATYAGRTAVVLQPMDVQDKRTIHDAITALESGGSTAMSSGLDLAYDLAMQRFETGAENRVIVMSDGDANVGSTGWEEMLAQIKDKANQGVTISTVGFGMGNYRDTLMEQLANNGDGNNFYIDSLQQAQRVFVEDMAGTIFTVARDVKLQVEFNEEAVTAYRLLGYENRDIADRDFRNDRVDAGEVGFGHNVTALYEVILRPNQTAQLATVNLRYEAPGADGDATEVAFPFPQGALNETVEQAQKNSQIAFASATFAEVLRGAPGAQEISMTELIEFTENAKRVGERDDRELLRLMRRAQQLGAGAGSGVAQR